MNSSPFATVFIPTYFGEEYLETLLESVVHQKVDFAYEILIYDTSSTDKTPEIIKSYTDTYDFIRVKTLTKAEYGHGKARRDAAYDAKGEIVVYLSQDALPAHNRWLYEMTKPFEFNDRIVGVLGKQDPRPNALPLLKYEIISVFKNFGSDMATSLFYTDTFVGGQAERDFLAFYSDVNSAARRSLLTGEIPYKPVAYAEDQLFGRDIIAAGYIKAYAPRGNVLHSNDVSLKDYKARLFDETMGLRSVGISVDKPSLRMITKLIVKGSLKDSLRILHDHDYSWKRKLYWLVINPLFHVEKWRGVRQGATVAVDNTAEIEQFSLEKQQQRQRTK